MSQKVILSYFKKINSFIRVLDNSQTRRYNQARKTTVQEEII
jgi:hypothetical protein